jgi:hypothetical protein
MWICPRDMVCRWEMGWCLGIGQDKMFLAAALGRGGKLIRARRCTKHGSGVVRVCVCMCVRCF